MCETLTNHDIFRQPSSINVLSFNMAAQGNDIPFSLEIVVAITHERNICSKTRLHDTTHEQTIIARHVMGSRPMESKKKCIE